MEQKVDNFRWKIRSQEIIPIITGGMGVDISSDRLALGAASLGGIGHISDAMVPTVTDRHFKTKYSRAKYEKYKHNKYSFDKTQVKFDLATISEATKLYVENTMAAKKPGRGMIFINCMEKLLMNNPQGTLQARLKAAMSAGIDGITLSAGLHLSSLDLIADHPRFRDVLIGIIVSSSRALRVFLTRAKRLGRLPDYIVVEGPLAGGHLGFGMDWQKYNLKTLVTEVLNFLKENSLVIPVIAAGGIFTGTDATEYLTMGAAAVQVATRFTITKECGLPAAVKQKYCAANQSDVVVSNLSPTGYPMRILTNSPGLKHYIRPNCEMYGFLLNKNGQCAYIDAYNQAQQASQASGEPLVVKDKVCLCTHMRNYKVWTCGHYVYRLKDTTNRLENGDYQLPDMTDVFTDYQFSVDHSIAKPKLLELEPSV